MVFTPDQFSLNEVWIAFRVNEAFLFVQDEPYDMYVLRARPKITSHFRISSSCHLRPILICKILEIVLLFLWFCAIGSSKSKTNLSANSVKLFLGEP